MRRRTMIIIGAFLAVAVVLVGFVVWAETPPAPILISECPEGKISGDHHEFY